MSFDQRCAFCGGPFDFAVQSDDGEANRSVSITEQGKTSILAPGSLHR